MRFLPGHWALGLQNLPLVPFHGCAWPCRTNAPSPFSAVVAHSVRPQAGLGLAPTDISERSFFFVGAGALTRPPFL